eukprot:COSAG01_NODE_1464_length_10228_cov_6.040774_6_plen_77_part_00
MIGTRGSSCYEALLTQDECDSPTLQWSCFKTMSLTSANKSHDWNCSDCGSAGTRDICSLMHAYCVCVAAGLSKRRA